MSKVSKGKLRYIKNLYLEPLEFLIAQAKAHQRMDEALGRRPIKAITRLAPDGGHYSGCTKLSSELDLEIVVQVQTCKQSDKYLMRQSGRHYNSGTPEQSLCPTLKPFQ